MIEIPQCLIIHITGKYVNFNFPIAIIVVAVTCRNQFRGLVQDYSISVANALEILKSCTKASKWCYNDGPNVFELQTVSLPRPYGNCTTGGYLPISRHQPYTSSRCFLEYETKQMFEDCNCILPHMPGQKVYHDDIYRCWVCYNTGEMNHLL